MNPGSQVLLFFYRCVEWWCTRFRGSRVQRGDSQLDGMSLLKEESNE